MTSENKLKVNCQSDSEPSGSPALPFAQARCHDFEELSSIREGWEMECRQLTRGPLDAQLARLLFPSGKLGLEIANTGCRVRGIMLAEQFQIGLVRTQGAPFSLWGERIEREALIFLGPNSFLDMICRSDIRVESISISAKALRERITAEGDAMEMIELFKAGEERIIHPSTQYLGAFKDVMTSLQRYVVNRPGAWKSSNARMLSNRAISVAGHILCEEADRPRRRNGHVRNKRREAALNAEDYMRRHEAERITSRDLCVYTGVSERTLEMAFKEEFSMTPRRYLAILRLNTARNLVARYSRSGQRDPVSQAAWDAGWMHASRFSEAYRRLFGEYPQDTARNERVMNSV